MLKEKVENLLAEAFEENKSLFLISYEIDDRNNIRVIIDGDEGVSVNDCIAVSRKVEHNLDREEQDFSLEVTSAGVTSDLRQPRQFRKNIGRKLAVKTKEDKFEADLAGVEENSILLEWKAREPKEVGKGKVTVEKSAEIPFEDIVEAKVVITF